ncbi:hypothetical protein DOTSEDRAFT_74134 [Dothistroma septosporum NZE10]|uniref:Uncharacterized protein n=1 Tax=Dothistroma septosporum (strain NZE10 / CBS 128990) TaxID=675120 RepID=N1PGJ8_DOTSN|nr:hypothetical protein DOTSEDRAFT_74134 [Dothistroma septosporum NZE10]
MSRLDEGCLQRTAAFHTGQDCVAYCPAESRVFIECRIEVQDRSSTNPAKQDGFTVLTTSVHHKVE